MPPITNYYCKYSVTSFVITQRNGLHSYSSSFQCVEVLCRLQCLAEISWVNNDGEWTIRTVQIGVVVFFPDEYACYPSSDFTLVLQQQLFLVGVVKNRSV